MENEAYQLLRLHACAEGVDEAGLLDIASHAHILSSESNDVIHQAEQLLTSVYLVVQGRIRCTATNFHGQVFFERIYARGDQFGGLGAALAEPIPVQVTSHGPSVLLRFEYEKLLELTLKYPKFRANFSRLVAQGVRKIAFGERSRSKAALITIFHESNASRELTVRLIKRLQQLGENPCLITDETPPPDLEGVPCRSLTEGDRSLSYEELRHQVHQWSDTSRVFIDLHADNTRLSHKDLVVLSEQVFWCVQPDGWTLAARRLRQIRETTPVWREKISVVWLLDSQQPVAPLVPELKDLALEDYKVGLEEPTALESRVLNNGVERLVHLLRGIRIGVALGGGAARGMAHLGVLKTLEQHGIVVDMIAGTSAGAMTGTLIATGMEHDYCANCFATDLKPNRPFSFFPRGDQWYLIYKYRRGHFDPMLRKYLGDVHLEQLPIPMRAITVDLVTGKQVIRDGGDAVHAILESINLPVISMPICREGRALVDGGLVNNVPADVLVNEGCNFVIAVSVTSQLEQRFGKNRPDTPTEKMKTPSTLQTLLRSQIVQHVNMNSIGVQPADVAIDPDVLDFELTAFSKTPQLAARGEQAALAALPKLRQMLTKIDDRLFPDNGQGNIGSP